MWFLEKALVAVDTRRASLAVYKNGRGGPSLIRFGSESLGVQRATGSFVDTLRESRPAMERLIRTLRPPTSGASCLLPIGVSFPSILEEPTLAKVTGSGVAEADIVRFRLAPLLPFPIAQAEVRTESSPSIGAGALLAQATLKTAIAASEQFMESLGFSGTHVVSTLSAALRGLGSRPSTVDLILGDSAFALAVRNDRGGIETIHLRLLVEGDDRMKRPVDEALRAVADASVVRVLGGEPGTFPPGTRGAEIVAAFPESTPAVAGADPQLFPFLSVFQERRSG
jgi:hypothetical protein